MIEQFRELLEIASALIEFFAIGVIVIGFLWAIATYSTALRSTTREAAFPVFRGRLGVILLVGLEILVIADVIESITVEPSYGSLAVLAFLVAVRTVVSWTTALQVEGRWPWQPEDREGKANA